MPGGCGKGVPYLGTNRIGLYNNIWWHGQNYCIIANLNDSVVQGNEFLHNHRAFSVCPYAEIHRVGPECSS